MVYVDNYYVTGVRFRGMKMCHMIADTTEELLAIVDAIGVQRKWIQHPGTPNEHFDICFSKRVKAVSFGAVEINYRDYAKKVEERCEANGIHWARSSVDKIRTKEVKHG
jgi:hypothetical protein